MDGYNDSCVVTYMFLTHDQVRDLIVTLIKDAI